MQNRVVESPPQSSHMTPKKPGRDQKPARAIGLGVLAILLFDAIPLTLASQSPRPGSQLRITTKSLPNATVGVEYYAVIAAAGGEPL